MTLLLSTTGTLITVMAYLQVVRGHLFQQDHRMASLELQSTSKAGECLFSLKTDNKFQIYMKIFDCIDFASRSFLVKNTLSQGLVTSIAPWECLSFP